MTEKEIWNFILDFDDKHKLFPKLKYTIIDDIKEAYPSEAVEPFCGCYFPDINEVIIVANQHKDIDDLQKTLQHETFGHFGINHLTPQQKTSLLNSISNETSSPFCDFKNIVEFVNNSKDYKDKFLNQKAEEIFAFIAQDTKINLDHKFVSFENKIDGSSKEKIEFIVQNLAAGIRENKLEVQKDNSINKTPSLYISL